MATASRSGPDRLERAYRRLVGLYPAGFRERFGDEMLELFRARRAAAARLGTTARTLFWFRTMLDAARSMWRERRIARVRAAGGAGGWLRRLHDDAHLARRALGRSPAFVVTVVLLTGVSAGAATTVFGLVNAILIRPLPYSDPSRLVLVWEHRSHRDRNVVSGHEFPEWQRRNHSFQAMAAITFTDGTHLTGAGDPVSLFAVRVTSQFFDVMGVPPALGRGFIPDEDVPGNGQVAVLSDRLWRDRFAADRGVIGRRILLNDRPFEVVGVMPPDFEFPPEPDGATPDVWSPIAEPIWNYRGRHYLVVVARLRPDVSIAQAQDDMAGVTAALEKDFGNLNKDHRATVVPLAADMVRDARTSLLLLLGAVFVLVLIGCVNVAGLLLARGLARRHETTLQLAIGATRWRLTRILFVESLALALAGSVLGLTLALGLTKIIPSLVPASVLVIDHVPLDRTVFSVALGMAVLTGLLFGAAPAAQLGRFNLNEALKLGGRTLAAGPAPRLRRILIAGQIALAVVLVLGAIAMMQNLAALHRVDPGFRPDGVLSIRLALPAARYDATRQRAFFDDLTQRVSAFPGVTAVAAASAVPLSNALSGIAISIEGRPAPPPGQESSARFRVVSASYFRTMGIPVRAGREFLTSDARVAVPLIRWWPGQPQPPGVNEPQPAPVAVINEALAQGYWPNEDPIGRRFRVLFSPWITIVGVAADAHNDSLRERPRPEFYLASSQEPQSEMSVVVRTASAPSDLPPLIRSAVRELDSNLPIASMKTMDEIVGTAMGLPRFMLTLLGTFGAMALALMAAGIYGLIVFTVSRQLPEVGIRLALGASRAQILRMVIGDGLALSAIGVVAGTAVAAGIARVAGREIYRMRPPDSSTLAAATLVVLSVVIAACWIPARRAARADPSIVLK